MEPSGAEPVNMWCHTCHRGVARPHTLDEALLETYPSDREKSMLTVLAADLKIAPGTGEIVLRLPKKME